MGKTVIQNGMIITVDRDDRVLDKGYLVIEGNKICLLYTSRCV